MIQYTQGFCDKKFKKNQFVHPHLHRRNAAERAIQKFKNKSIAGISSVNKGFPIHNWCRLNFQACLVMNILQQSRINPKLVAYAQLHREYNFNATPVAPPGNPIVVHEKSAFFGSKAIQGIDGWYLGQALHHYRCFEVFSRNTTHSRIADNVEFSLYPSTMPFP